MCDIEVDDITKYNCIHYGISRIADNLCKDYQMVFLELWRFKYSSDPTKKIGENLDINWLDCDQRRDYLLKKFHGFYTKTVKISSINVKVIVQKQPIMAFVDAFDCDWLPFYRKHHIKHTIIVYSINKDDIYFYDQYVQMRDKRKMNDTYFSKICKEVVLFYCNNNDIQISEGDYFKEIVRSAEIYVQNNSEKNLALFVSDMMEKFHLVHEINKEDATSSALIKCLKYIGEDRYNMVNTFIYLERKFGWNFERIKKSLWEIFKKYDELRFYLLKNVYIKGSVEKHHLYHLLKSIQEKENTTNELLLKM